MKKEIKCFLRSLSILSFMLTACVEQASHTENEDELVTATSDSGETQSDEQSNDETARDEESSCCGCLCADPNWSCSFDTCSNEQGEVIRLGPEAGFIQVNGRPFTLDGHEFQFADTRVWYTYQPADSSPETKPLLVFFNGGPGAATMSVLFALNTAPYTLDPNQTGDDDYKVNDASWTRFANLLYIDAPNTGFSYSLMDPEDPERLDYFDYDRDAAVVNYVLLHFLKHHPGLGSNKVVLVGESYGGTRAQFMLQQALFYEKLRGDGFYSDEYLARAFEEHFARTRPDTSGELSPFDVAEQFVGQILIQPYVTFDSRETWERPKDFFDGCIPDGDWSQCDTTEEYLKNSKQIVANRLVEPDVLSNVFKIDIASIEWMHASERRQTFSREDVRLVVDQSSLEGVFGELGPGQKYFSSQISVDYDFVRAHSRDIYDDTVTRYAPLTELFLTNTYFGKVLITNADLDLIIDSPYIPESLGVYGSQIIDRSEHVLSTNEDIERPGWISLRYRSDEFPGSLGDTERQIRFPFYGRSGHAVTRREPIELLHDIEDFFNG